MNTQQSQRGAVNPLVISNVLVAVVAVAFAGVAIWAYINYTDQKNNVDAKIATAVKSAKEEQLAKDEADFKEKEKQPTRDFVGPDDLGRVTFKYPKTWSVYVAKNGSDGKYEAYLNPNVVPPVSNSQPFATRVTVEDKSYEDSLTAYQRKVTAKELTSSPITIGEFTGIRLDGTFSAERKGTAVVLKVRDKTLTVASDAETFKNDFNTIILASLSFNP